MSKSEEYKAQKFQKGQSGNPNGRPKGAKNKRTQKAMELAQKLKCDPFEILLYFAKGDWKALGYKTERLTTEKIITEEIEGDITEVKEVIEGELVITPEMRLQAARDAAPYLYPKLRTVEFVPQEDGDGTITTFKFVQVKQPKQKPKRKK